uniref:Genome polyprotein n=1 Tax=Eureka dunegrass waikavirus TaxID=3115787 RepID=A0AAT9JHR7_9SECO
MNGSALGKSLGNAHMSSDLLSHSKQCTLRIPMSRNMTSFHANNNNNQANNRARTDATLGLHSGEDHICPCCCDDLDEHHVCSDWGSDPSFPPYIPSPTPQFLVRFKGEFDSGVSSITSSVVKTCDHSFCFSVRLSNKFCATCRFLESIFQFYKSHKFLLYRENIGRLCNWSAEELLSKAILFVDGVRIDAEVVASHRVSCEHDKLLSPDAGSSDETTSHASDWNMCDNVKHLFECFSIGDASRGRFFGLSVSGNSWHATCKRCNASCKGTTCRTALPVIFLLRFCKLHYIMNKWYISHIVDRDLLEIDLLTAHFISGVLGEEVEVDAAALEMSKRNVMMWSMLQPPNESASCYNEETRHPKALGLLSDDICEHSFEIWNRHGVCIPLSRSMLLTFMLMGCDHGIVSCKSGEFGLVSFGGLIGVNVFCNKQFFDFHSRFYSGSFRTPHRTNIVVERCDAQSGLDDEEFERLMHMQDGLPLVKKDPNTKSMIDDVVVFEMEDEGSHARGLGLSERLGGLLQGVSHCVSALHQVWDWPLDLALTAVEGTGNWLAGNSKAISSDKICVGCPAIQQDLADLRMEAQKAMEIIRASIKKLSEGIDAITRMNKVNFERVMERFGKVDERLIELERFRQESESQKGDSKATQALVTAIADIKKMKIALADLNDRLKKIESQKPSHADVPGEQLPLPSRLRALAEMDEGTIMIDDEVRQSYDSTESSITDPNFSDVHNAIRANYLVKDFSWGVSDGEDRVIANIDLPSDLWEANNRLNDFLSLFQYYSVSGLTFEICLTSAPMHGGTLFVGWDACGCASRQQIATTTQLSGLQGVYIQACKGSRTTFSVRSPAIQDVICLSGSESSFGRLGILKVCIVNVLNAPKDAAQKVAGTVWVRFDNPKLHYYTLRHNPVIAQMDANRLRDIDGLEAIVGGGNWSTTSQRNLITLNVHPTACKIGNGLVTHTPLGVVSQPFARWSGGLTFRFIFGASQFARGRLLIAAIPVAFRDKTITIGQMSAFHNVECLLSGETMEFELNVPYHSIGRNSMVSRDGMFDMSSHDPTYLITRLHVLVLDSLVLNANASNQISFTVTMRPGPGFELMNLRGVLSEPIVRTLKQVDLGQSFESGKLLGSGFHEIISRHSVAMNVLFDNDKNNALLLMVAPAYRHLPPQATLLSWMSQLFVQWSGGIMYRLSAYGNDRKSGGFIRIWHDPNGSLEQGEEFAAAQNLDPYPGAQITYWNFNDGPIEYYVPYVARTPRLFVPKVRIASDKRSWIINYNGMLCIDYNGNQPGFAVEIGQRAADDFNFWTRTVAPRCGKVSKGFTQLAYASDLNDISSPAKGTVRVGGALSNRNVRPLKFQETENVRSKVSVTDAFSEFDKARAEMDCGLKGFVQANKIINKRATCEKVADVVDFTHSLLPKDYNPEDFNAILGKVAPLLNSMTKTSKNIEEKMSSFDTLMDRILKFGKGFLGKTICFDAMQAYKDGKMSKAVLLSLIGGIAIAWTCKSVKGMIRKLSILMMILWSPFLYTNVWKLGKWITKKWTSTWKKSETCRKHSLAGLCEQAKEAFANFPDWFASEGLNVLGQLLTVLMTVVSLIAWGTIPTTKQTQTWAQKFKEFGERGRAISSATSGFRSLSTMCKGFSDFIVTNFFGAEIDDQAYSTMTKFNIAEWVEEVKIFSLEENKFVGFGGEEHLRKVRLMYDRSLEIQADLMRKHTFKPAMVSIIRDTCKKCEDLLNESYTFKGMKTPRIDPFYMCLEGAPGVGKSSVATKVINDIMDYMGEPKTDRIYTRCCADQYWSNYHHEPVIFYDDLGAITRQGTLSDYAEIMGVKSNRPFSLPMAAVEEKGRHCLSKYLVACTNIGKLDDSGDVKTKEAYYRRINLPVNVSRDLNAPMNPNNPTEGLRFRVDEILHLGEYVCVLEHPLLRGKVGLSPLDLQEMNYEEFLSFAKLYCRLYIENQTKLVNTLNGYDESIELSSDDCEAQSGEEVSLKYLMDKFSVKGHELNCQMKMIGLTENDCWSTSKTLSMQEALGTLCGCGLQENCNFSFYLKRINSNISKLPGLKCYDRFGLVKVGRSPEETLVRIKNGSLDNPFEGFSELHVLGFIGAWLQFGVRDDELCFSYQLNGTPQIKEYTYECEDSLRNMKFVKINSVSCRVWPSCSKLFSRIVAESGCLSLYDGENYHNLVPHERSSFVQPAISWQKLLSGLADVNLTILKLAGSRKSGLIAGLVESHWQVIDNMSEWKDICHEVFEDMGFEDGILFVLGCALKKGESARKNCAVKSNKRKINMEKLVDNLKEHQTKLIQKLSPHSKKILSIGGAVVAFGALAGAVIGCMKFFRKVTQSFETEEDDIMVNEVSAASASDGFATSYRKIQKRPPVFRVKKQMAMASASDDHRTRYVMKQRMAPRVRVGKEMNAASASDSHCTKYKMSQRRIPMKRVQKEGFMVTYDDRDEDFLKTVRRLRRRKMRKALAHMAGLEDYPDTMEEITSWQNWLLSKGCLPPDSSKQEIFEKTLEGEICETLIQAENMLNGPTLEHDDAKLKKLHETVMIDKGGEIQKMISEGVRHETEKQAQVGAMGLAKDPNMIELVNTHVSRMSCVIVDATKNKVFNVLRLKGSFVVCPAHYFEEFDEHSELHFVCLNKIVRIDFNPSRVSLVSKHQDLVVWDLGNAVPPSSNFIQHIANYEDWRHFQDGPGVFSQMRYSGRVAMQVVHALGMIERIKINTETPTAVYSMLGSDHTITTGLRYHIYSLPGFCGGVVLRANPKMVRKIVGLHVAGRRERAMGYSEMLIAEDLEAAMSRISNSYQFHIEGHLKPAVDVCTKESGLDRPLRALGCHGKVFPEDVSKMSVKTSIRPSLIHGLIGEVKTEPSILSKFDRRLGPLEGKFDPVLEAAMKYGSPIVPFPQESVDEVEEHLISVFKNMDNTLNKRSVNNLEIGINGIDLSDYWLPIEMTTSSGWPYSKRKPKGAEGKKWLFEEDGKYPSGRIRYKFKDEGLIESYNFMLSEAKAGRAPQVVTIECPKDERRKLAKIYEKPATRTFTILPPEINILFRQYFGDFAAMVMSNRGISFCQVGINPETVEWSDLMNNLKKIGERGFAGDYSKFDGIGDPTIYHSIVNVVNAWYDDGEENARIRHCLLNSIVHRDGIVNDLLFKYSQGMPSGFAMTVIFNSFVNYYYLALSWMYLISTSPLSAQSDLKSFDNYTKVIVYGDDNVVAVDKDFLPYYNLRSVACFLDNFGVSYTDDSKNPIHLSKADVEISSVTFLKRSWVPLSGSLGMFYKAPLDKTSIEERCNWIRECDDPEEALNQNVESALYEASIHDFTYFKDLKDRLEVAYDRVQCTLPEVSYRNCQRRWWTNMTGAAPSATDISRIVNASNAGRLDPKTVFEDAYFKEKCSLGEMLSRAKAAPLAAFQV